MQFTGELIVKGETQQVTDKFQKREFVLRDSGKYPQTIQFELTQKNCSILDGINEGETITIDFSLRGREWKNKSGETKYFNTLNAFRVTRSGKMMEADRTQGSDLPF